MPCGSNAAIALVLAVGAGAMLAAFDRIWQGAAMALGTGVGGVVVEATLVRLGLFHHRRPDVGGLPVWLPLLYVGGPVAIGNLARAWARAPARDGRRRPRGGEGLDAP